MLRHLTLSLGASQCKSVTEKEMVAGKDMGLMGKCNSSDTSSDFVLLKTI